MEKIRFLSVALFFYLCVFAGQAQERSLKFEHISLEEGLSQSSVHTILQDSKGFMWFGTLDGLNKYDGYKIKIYRHEIENPESLADNSINIIFEDSHGTLWVGTRTGGLSKHNKVKNNFTNYFHLPTDDKSLSNSNVTAIAEDNNQTLWVGTTDGLNRFDAKNQNFQRFYADENPQTLSSSAIKTILADQKGNLWVGTNKGLNRFEIATAKVQVFEKKDGLASNQINAMAQSGNVLWLATEKGLNRLNLESHKIETFSESQLHQKRYTSVAIDQNGVVWAGTEKSGIVCFDPQTHQFTTFSHSPNSSHSLSVNHVLSLFFDRTNVLWAGTSLGGVNKWNRASENIQVYRHHAGNPNSLSSNQVRSIYQDQSGQIWLGTVDGGINKWIIEENRFEHFSESSQTKQKLNDKHIRAMLEDNNGNFWVGTDGGGLNRFNRNTGTFTPVKSAKAEQNQKIWDIYQDPQKNIWICALDGGLSKFDPKTQRFESYPRNGKNFSSDKITTMLVDKNGNYWIGTLGGGINLWNPAKNEIKVLSHIGGDTTSLTDNRIYSIFEDRQNNIWVGTKSGLNKYLPEKEAFQRYGTKNGFANNVMMGILQDKAGNLWISTNSGLSKFDPKTGKVKNYDVKDGLQSNEFLVGAYCKTRDGRMLFGGIKGFNVFKPEEITPNPYKPPIVITGFQIFNKEIELDTVINEKSQLFLDYDDNVFSFDFVALDYTFPEKNRYAYKLEGFDSEWIDWGTRRYVSFTNLPPGSYTFRVKGSNSDGVWNQLGASIQIHIAPPFWKTTWFRITVIAILLSGFLIFIKLRERKLKRDKQILELTVKERTREVVEQRNEIQRQRDLVAQQKQDITDSIEYASRIQNAVLPPKEVLSRNLPQHFVFFRPRDIVSGDFYWMNQIEGKTVVAAADCTGHGVPGAFMSMLGIAFLNEIVNKTRILQANEILNKLRDYVKKSLHQTGGDSEAKDGMDIALCIIDHQKKCLQFAGAFNPLMLIRNNEVQMVKADKMPIGIYHEVEHPFTNNLVELQTGDLVYIYSDGYVDQFGGPRGKKFLKKRFREMLLEIHQKPLPQQHNIIVERFDHWKGDLEQVDDVLVLGFKVT